MWLKLRKRLYSLFDPKLDIQIHYTTTPFGGNVSTWSRYWITLDKEIIWDFPKDFHYDERLLPECYPYNTFPKEPIIGIFAAYYNSPDPLHFSSPEDIWGLGKILKFCDRRIGKRKVKDLIQISDGNPLLMDILARRFPNEHKKKRRTMTKLEKHSSDSFWLFGETFEEVHRWLDEFAGKKGYGMHHHWVRHHRAGIEEARKLFGDEGAKAAAIHIISDLREEVDIGSLEIPTDEQEYIRKGFGPKS